MTGLPITQLTSLQISNPEGDSRQGGFYLGQLTAQQIANLQLIQNGTMVYNLTLNKINIYQSGKWGSLPELDPVVLPEINIGN